MKTVSTRSRILASVVLSLLPQLCVPAVGLAQGGGTVTGLVVDQTDLPFPGVSVQLQSDMTEDPIETVTDGDGTYRFSGVPAGPAELTFRLINFSTIRRDLIMTSGGTVTADALMVIASNSIPRQSRGL